MRLLAAAALAAMFLQPSLACAHQDPPDEFVVHGTINIVLGNENGLVVLTDSMATSGERQLPDPNQKLFKLGDRTVCAIAGFASAPAASQRAAIPDLNTNVSAIIHEYVRQSANQPQSIGEKLKALAFLLELHLSTIANVRDALGEQTTIDSYRFQLIVAGYDLDDKPKIGKVVLGTRNDGSLFSEIEEVSISAVQHKFVWRLNGMPDVAERLLRHPESAPQDAVVTSYATSIRENGGESLTLNEMTELAKRLAYYTAKTHREVGGPNQVAILQNSHITSIDQPTFPDLPKPPNLKFSIMVKSTTRGSGISVADGIAMVFIRCSWSETERKLDGNYFIENDFKNSVLVYDGGSVNFGGTNRVVDSVLLIGPHAKLDDKTAQRLIKAFAWSKVLYQPPETKPL